MPFTFLIAHSGARSSKSVSPRIRSAQAHSGLGARSRRLLWAIAVSVALAVCATDSMAASDPSIAESKPAPDGKPGFCSAAATMLLPGAASVAAKSVGVTAVLHSSGAWILTGATGYFANTLAGAAATVLGIFTVPWVVGTAATIGIVGGVYCLVAGNDAKHAQGSSE